MGVPFTPGVALGGGGGLIGLVIALRLVVLALGAALGVFYPFIPVILQGFGFGPAEIGLVTSAAALGFTLAVPAWGHLADVRHEWYLKGMSKEQLDKIRKDYEERYGRGGATAK